jgi:Na+-driven multidrug efflux pump
VVVAAFEIARRVWNFMNAFRAGFSMSASSLLGQALGRGDETEAAAVSRDAVTFSAFVYVLGSLLVLSLASRLARLFASESRGLARTTPFVRVAAVSFV